jgi:hypothetical protein
MLAQPDWEGKQNGMHNDDTLTLKSDHYDEFERAGEECTGIAFRQ